MNFQYRIGKTSDLDKLKQLGMSSYLEYSNILSSDNWFKMKSFINDENALLNLLIDSTCYTCEANSEIVGMVYFVPSNHNYEMFDPNWSIIRYLAVHPNFRGNGIASKLTDLCLVQATNTEEKFVALHTAYNTQSAIAIYEKRGFNRTKKIVRYGIEYWIYLLKIN